jgi:hypothetical protein
VLTGLVTLSRNPARKSGSPAAMARSFLPAASLAALLATFALAAPAQAQFGNIFGGPPRPPADVDRPAPMGVPREMPPEEMDDEDQPPPPPRPPARQQRAPQQQAAPQYPQQQYPQQQQQGGVRSQPLAPPQQQQAAPGQAAPPAQQAAPAQRAPQTAARGTPAPANTAPQPGDEVVVEPPAQKIANPTAVFAGLDKVTGRITSFDVALNETVQFGALQVTPRVCYTRPPTERANTDSFVEVSEVTLQGEIKRIFTGWMFASSPGLHAVEHPIYDVWLTDCKGGTAPVADATPPAPATPARAQQRAPASNTTRSAPAQRAPVQQPTLQQPAPVGPPPGFR